GPLQRSARNRGGPRHSAGALLGVLVAHAASAAVVDEAGRVYGIGVDPVAAPRESGSLRPALCILRRAPRSPAARGSRGHRVMPDNWGFVAAAYGITAVVLLIYWRRLAKREREVTTLKRLNAERSREPSSSGHPRSDPSSRTPIQRSHEPSRTGHPHPDPRSGPSLQ